MPKQEVLKIQVDVNPVSVSANKRYRSNETIPRDVREEMARITEAADAAAKAIDWYPPNGPLGIKLWFTFKDLRGDTDNPLKRTIDAICANLPFNDSKFVEYHVWRRRGTPGIEAHLYETVVQGEGAGPVSYNNDPVFVFTKKGGGDVVK